MNYSQVETTVVSKKKTNKYINNNTIKTTLHVTEHWRTLTKSPFNQLSSLTACLIGCCPSGKLTVPWLTSGYWVDEWFPQMMTFSTSCTRMPSLLAICINQGRQLLVNRPFAMSLAEFESNFTGTAAYIAFWSICKSLVHRTIYLSVFQRLRFMIWIPCVSLFTQQFFSHVKLLGSSKQYNRSSYARQL